MDNVHCNSSEGLPIVPYLAKNFTELVKVRLKFGLAATE